MRNISFALTTPQFLDGTKDVTRRMGWLFLKPGDELCAIEKGQGLGKGNKFKDRGVGMAQSFFERWSDVIRRTAMPSTLVCTMCDGRKIIAGPRYHATGTLTDVKPCPNCDGRGYSSRVTEPHP